MNKIIEVLMAKLNNIGVIPDKRRHNWKNIIEKKNHLVYLQNLLQQINMINKSYFDYFLKNFEIKTSKIFEKTMASK